MDGYKYMTWLFGIGFIAMFLLANLAFNERDNALRFKAEFGSVDLICRAVSKPE